MSLLDTLVFQPILLAIHAADIFTQSLSSAASAGLIPSGLCLSTAPSKHKIPKHVAFSLVISDEWKLGSLDRRTRHDARARRNSVNRWHDSPLRSENKGKGRETWEQAESDDEEWSTAERQALLSTIQEAVRWAVVRDISEISLWNEDGLLDKHLESLISFLVERPPTPPASGTSSPPPYDRQRCTNTTKSDEIHTASPATSAHPSFPPDMQGSWIQVETPHMSESHASNQSPDPAQAMTEFNASRSFTVWPDLEDILPGYNHCDQASFSTTSTISSKTTSALLRGTNGTSPVTVHVLSRDAGDPMIAHITKKLIANGVPSELVSQQMIEELIQEQLHFQHDPCLLIVQPLAFERSATRRTRQPILHSSSQLPLTYRLLKQIVPPDPPQLHGYPFWPLRVTEIYQSPITRRGSSNTAGPSAHRVPWTGSRKRVDVTGNEGIDRMIWASWDYGIQRWQGVEQRLGR